MKTPNKTKEIKKNAGIRITDSKKRMLIRKYGSFQKAIDKAIELMLMSEEIINLHGTTGKRDEE